MVFDYWFDCLHYSTEIKFDLCTLIDADSRILYERRWQFIDLNEILRFQFFDMNRTCLILFIRKGSCYYTTKTDQSFIFISWQILITILKTCELTSNLNLYLNVIFSRTILHLIWFQSLFDLFLFFFSFTFDGWFSKRFDGSHE